MTAGDADPVPAALREMREGIAYWRSRHWPADLHNADYEEWAGQNPDGDFTPDWWHRYQLPRLTRWIATRPVSCTLLTTRFTEAIPALGAAWRKACLPHLDDDIAAVTWDEVKAFPGEVAKIKPMKSGRPSAVFTSKFCHFLLPSVFPVVDNAGLGAAWQSYETHFRRVQDAWASTDTPTRAALIVELIRVIEAEGQPVSPVFPRDQQDRGAAPHWPVPPSRTRLTATGGFRVSSSAG